MSIERNGKQKFPLNAKLCSNCSVAEGSAIAPKLSACARCGLERYCSKDCQRAHWKANHKQHCIAKADRTPQLQKPANVNKSASQVVAVGTNCAICQDVIVERSTRCILPCNHVFHSTCVAELRKFGVDQACPLCRTLLPPGPEQRNEEASRRYMLIYRVVERGDASWSALPKWAQEEADAAIREWQASADEGNACAQYNVGIQYETGELIVQNYVEAARWFEKAAKQGLAGAQFNLGNYRKLGQGVVQSEVEATRWYKKAAAQGHLEAQNSLGFQYQDGLGVAQSYEEAVRWYRKAADQGHPMAQCNMGVMYELGNGVPRSDENATRYFKKAADQGLAVGQFYLGMNYVRGCGVAENDPEAVRWFKKAADQGYARAQFNLGMMLERGQGVAQSYEEAVKWFKKAAHQGDSDALCKLGTM